MLSKSTRALVTDEVNAGISGRFMRLAARIARQSVATLLSGLLVFQPMLLQAQVVPDVNAPIANQPDVGAAPNGVPLVDIAAPNNRGLSHNKYHDFNVDQRGAIMNNLNAEHGTSQLGGVTPGNPNLKTSGPASVILNEVTSSNRSLLEGAIEVFGHRADVIVANPNGIFCSGCGFIGAPRATLTTGTPDIDASGRLGGFTVQGGDVTFGPKGGNFAAGDGAVDLFDIVSRRVQIDGPVSGKNLRLSVGRQKFDYATGETTPLDGADDAGEFAIDGSALGAMQADRIKIVVTDKGAGVRMRGDMAANAGDLTLSADGKISLGNASGRDGVSIKSKSKKVEAKKVTSKKKVTVKAEQGIAIQSVAADEDIMLNAGTGLLSIAGDAAALGAIEMTTAGAIAAGNVSAGRNASLRAGQGIVAGSVNADAAASLSTSYGNIVLAGTARAGGGDLVLEAASGSITGTSLISFNNMTLTAGQDIVLGDGILSGGALVAGARNLKATSAASGVDFSATEAAGGNIRLGSAGDMRLLASGGAVDIGTILSGGRLDASGSTIRADNITSYGAVNLAGTTTVNGQLLSGSDIVITGPSITLGTAFAGVDVTALELGNVIPGKQGDLTLIASLGDVTADRLISAGNMAVTAKGDVTANTLSYGDLIVNAGGGLVLTAQSLAGGNVTLNADSMKLDTLVSGVDFAATNLAGGSLILKTANPAMGQMSLAASGSITANQLISGGNLTARARQDISYNSLQSFAAADLTSLQGRISLDRNTVARGNLTLTLNSLDLSNDQGKLATAGTLVVHANDANLANSTLTFGGIALNLAGSVDASGTRLSAVTADGGSGDIAITAQTINTNAATTILAAHDLTLTLASLANAGQLAANNDLVFNVAGNLTNSPTGLIYAGHDGRLYVAGDLLNDQGAILIGNDLTIAADANGGRNASLTNVSGLIQAGRDASILTANLTNRRLSTPTITTYAVSEGDSVAFLVPTLFEKAKNDGFLAVFDGYAGYIEGAYVVAKGLRDEAKGYLTLADGTAYRSWTWLYSGAIADYTHYHWNDAAGMRQTIHEDRFDAALTPEAQIRVGRDLTSDATVLQNSYSSIEAGGNAVLTGDTLINEGVTLRRSSLTYCDSNDVCEGYDTDGKRQADLDIAAGSSRLIDGQVIGSAAGLIKAGGALDVSGFASIANTSAEGSIAGNAALAPVTRPGDPTSALDSLTAGGALFTPNAALGSGLTGADLIAALGQSAPKPNSGGFGGTIPGQVFLYETRAEFLDVSRYYGSGYFLNRIGFTPDRNILFLGDAYFENELITQQLKQLRGIGLGVGDAAINALHVLLDNGAAFLQQHGLNFGDAPTAEQLAGLEHSIVLYQKQIIEGVEVYAPVVYPGKNDSDEMKLAGAMMTGQSLNLSGDNLINSGAISAAGDLRIDMSASLTADGGSFTAGGLAALRSGGDMRLSAQTATIGGQNVTVAGSGVTSGGDTVLAAQGELRLEGTSFAAGGDVSLTGHEIVLDVARATQNGSQNVQRTAIRSGGDTQIVADTDVTVIGSQIDAGGNLTLDGQNGSVNIEAASIERQYSHGTLTGSETAQLSAQLASGGDTNIRASDTVTVIGSRVDASGNLSVEAKDGSVNIVTAGNSRLTSGEIEERIVDQQPSGLSAGKNVAIAAGDDILVSGSDIAAGGSVDLDAGGNVSITTAHNDYAVDRPVQNGRASAEDYQTQQGSTVKAGGDVSIAAGQSGQGDVSVIGSRINASGTVDIRAADNVTVAEVNDEQHHETHYRNGSHRNDEITDTSSAVGSSISGAAGVNISSGGNTTVSASSIQAGSEEQKADINIDVGGDLIIASGKDTAETNKSQSNNGLLSKSSSKSHAYDETTVASDLSASGNVNLNADRQVVIAGSNVTAGDNIAIEGDSVSIIGAQEQHDASSSSKKSGFGAGSGDGFYSIWGKEAKSHSESATVNVGSSLSAGNDVVITARDTDVNIIGSHLQAGNDIVLEAERDVNIMPGAESYLSEDKESRSGFGIQVATGSGSASIGIGYGASKTESSQGAEINAVSSLNAGRDVIITAGRDANLQAAQVSAGSTVDILAERDVNLLSAQDKTNYEYMHQELFAGVTATVSSQAAAAVGNAYEAASRIGDGNAANSIAMGAIAGINGMYAYNALTNGQTLNDGFYQNGPLLQTSIGVGFQYSKNSGEGSTSTPVPTTITAGGTVIIEADRDINAAGAQISAGYDQYGLPTGGRGDIALIAGNDINLESAKATTENSSKNVSAGASINLDLSGGSFNYGQGKGNDSAVTNINTHVTGSGTVYVQSGNDTNLRGATVSGETVIADIGGDLNIESQLDTAKANAKQVNVGGSVGQNAQGQTTGGVSGSYQTAKGDAAIVSEQSGIHAGEGGFDIKVDGNTKLVGGLITSEAEPENNRLETGTLEFEDLDTHSKWKAETYGGGMTSSGPLVSPPMKEGESDTGKALSAVSPGQIVITNPDNQKQNIDDLRRDTADTNTSLPGIPDLQALLAEQLKTQQLYDDAAAKAAKMIGDYASDRYTEAYKNDNKAEMEFWKEGGNGPAILHAIAGGLLGGVNDFSGMLSGMAGGAMSAKLAPEIHKLVEQFVQDAGLTGAAADLMVNSITGSILQGLGAATGGTGAAYAGNTYQNNYLQHYQIEEFVEELAACRSDAACEQEVGKKYQQISNNNNQELLKAIDDKNLVGILLALSADNSANLYENALGMLGGNSSAASIFFDVYHAGNNVQLTNGSSETFNLVAFYAARDVIAEDVLSGKRQISEIYDLAYAQFGAGIFSPNIAMVLASAAKQAGKVDEIPQQYQETAQSALKSAEIRSLESSAKKVFETSNGSVVRPSVSPYYSNVYEVQLPAAAYPGSSRQLHNQLSNQALHEAFQADPVFAVRMESLYPGIIKGVQPGTRGAYSRTAPTADVTWHHGDQPGQMQLVPREHHTAPGPVQENLHPGGTGGYSQWGKE